MTTRAGERYACPGCETYALFTFGVIRIGEKDFEAGRCQNCGMTFQARDLPSPISRQRFWQLARIMEGKCRNCGKPRGTLPAGTRDSQMCSDCLNARKEKSCTGSHGSL